jgi:hypothetical protein
LAAGRLTSLPKAALRFAFTIALRQTSSSRNALRVPVNLPINVKLLMDGVNAEGVVRRTLT